MCDECREKGDISLEGESKEKEGKTDVINRWHHRILEGIFEQVK